MRMCVPPKERKLRLSHMLEAGSRVDPSTAGTTSEAFESNGLVSDAVIHNVQGIGDAARHVPLETTDRYPDIPWALIRGMRNFIVRRYFGVRLRTVWDTAVIHIPMVVSKLNVLLEDEQ